MCLGAANWERDVRHRAKEVSVARQDVDRASAMQSDRSTRPCAQARPVSSTLAAACRNGGHPSHPPGPPGRCSVSRRVLSPPSK